MKMKTSIKRLGFFTRLLDETDAAERYRLATEQIVQARRVGFPIRVDRAASFPRGRGRTAGAVRVPGACCGGDDAHPPRHRHRHPAAQAAVRVAEDAVVLDLLCDKRLEVGVGPGGNLTAFTAFGRDSRTATR